MTLFGICGCYGFLEAILNNHIIEIAEFKFYILPVVAFYLLEKLVSQSTSNPLVDSLIDIRRDLVFNNTPVEDALKQAEIAILGLKFKEIIHEDSAKLIELIRLIKGNYLLVSDRIKNMSQDIANLKSGKPLIEKVIEKTEEFKVIFESCHYQSSLAKNHVTEALKISHRLRQKLKFLVLMYDIKDEVDELICKVEDEIRNFESVANNLENNIIELEKQAESLFHREDKRPEQLT